MKIYDILKNKNNKIIGYIYYSGKGQSLKDKNNNLIAMWDRNDNITRNLNGKIVGYGNVLSSFIDLDTGNIIKKYTI
jgi:hypothetical protein